MLINPTARTGIQLITTTTQVDAATVGTTETALCTLTIPANSWTVGSMRYGYLIGRWTRSGSGPTILNNLRLNDATTGTLLLGRPAANANISGITDDLLLWRFQATLISATTAWFTGIAFDSNISNSSAALTASSPNSAGTPLAGTNNAVITVDPTADINLIWTVKFGANTLGNSCYCDPGTFLGPVNFF